ncbi:hypothetical protein [Chengkuizengella axinellae]|uniref:Uncharacterized protein n=1 Tax=Chengkuizengella axinellae TaxID=3064388 RepID=A0ABT9J331_9BACL|nr:hypothetical protein [Chengkuizengella sp. 2205SS18-9]MDP5276024.1 hypothetical protein [Chengkuizengella sp. 2205SS18-9]
MYSEHLIRGNSYQVIDINNEKELIRIKTEQGKLCWFPQHLFNLNGEEVVCLLDWKFDDEVTDDPLETNWIEISLNMNDGV